MQAPKSTRSTSTTSVVSHASSASSTTSRLTPEDLYERLGGRKADDALCVWSAGHVRVNGCDMDMPSPEAVSLVVALRSDRRFELVKFTYFDAEDDEWKATYRCSS